MDGAARLARHPNLIEPRTPIAPSGVGLARYCSIAPEICVEVWSASNTTGEIENKRKLYFAKGALEFWYCDERGRMSFFNRQTQLAKSAFCPDFPVNLETT